MWRLVEGNSAVLKVITLTSQLTSTVCFFSSCVNCSQLTDGILTALESAMDDSIEEDDIVRNLPQSMSFLC